MFKVIESPAKCDKRFVIRFLTARNMSGDNHRQITDVYGIEATSDSRAQKWVCHLIGLFDSLRGKGGDMLSRNFTKDETWISHITPEANQQSMELRHTSSPVKVKAKRTLSMRKIMATVFWDRHGVFW
ncbi:HTH_48 domain-containing protein [Trichonephila clavipes]|nr:HTH_48 domain-containing protein [Trichonephila clavipes]